jgi:hypothetical protein
MTNNKYFIKGYIEKRAAIWDDLSTWYSSLQKNLKDVYKGPGTDYNIPSIFGLTTPKGLFKGTNKIYKMPKG